MAFLDNSGDIILDAVLTDTGRMRMAKGDGSFKITKFALGDDEINYKLFNGNDSRGPAYYDIQIMETPILEAFTNNTSGMHSRLMSLANNPGLYLPVMLLNELNADYVMNAEYGTFFCAVDGITQNGISGGSGTTDMTIWKALGFNNLEEAGVIAGFPDNYGSFIRIDQGIDAPDGPSAANDLSAELYESQYLIEMDSRLCSLISKDDPPTLAAVSFIDDDSIASYYLSQAVNGSFIITTPNANDTSAGSNNVIRGPRGSRLTFSLRASLNLTTSTALFTQLGSTMVENGVTFYYIDTSIRVTGVTTGSRLDIPVRFVKWVSGP